MIIYNIVFENTKHSILYKKIAIFAIPKIGFCFQKSEYFCAEGITADITSVRIKCKIKKSLNIIIQTRQLSCILLSVLLYSFPLDYLPCLFGLFHIDDPLIWRASEYKSYILFCLNKGTINQKIDVWEEFFCAFNACTTAF